MLFRNCLLLLARCFAIGALSLSLVGLSQAAVEEVADEDLSLVSAADGVTINFILQWNPNRTEVDLASSVSIGFYEKSQWTYWVMHGFGGVMEFWGLKIDARKGPADVGDYVEITMPAYVGFENFGVQAMSVQNDPKVAPTTSYGQWYLNGSATVTGSVYIWPAK